MENFLQHVWLLAVALTWRQFNSHRLQVNPRSLTYTFSITNFPDFQKNAEKRKNKLLIQTGASITNIFTLQKVNYTKKMNQLQ